MWIMISEYDLSFGYEYKLFESLIFSFSYCLPVSGKIKLYIKSGLSNRREKLVRFIIVRVEYDRSNRYVCIKIGNRLIGLPMQSLTGS